MGREIFGNFIIDDKEITYFIPTFEELCFKTPTNNSKDNLYDIRLYNSKSQMKEINPEYKYFYELLEKDSKTISNTIINCIKFSYEKQDVVKLFLNLLSQKERTALGILLKEVGEEKLISILNLSQESGISRNILADVATKMRDAGIADVVNAGARGTYIKIINKEILREGK